MTIGLFAGWRVTMRGVELCNFSPPSLNESANYYVTDEMNHNNYQ